MEARIIELYSREELDRLARKIRRWRIALWSVAVAALAACIIIIAMTNRRNASAMETIVVALSTITGWFLIYSHTFVVTNARRELGHARMLREEVRETVQGTVTVTGERIVIRNSITARRVEVLSGGKTLRLMVSETRADKLAKANTVTLYTAHSYVAAYEVMS